MNPIVDPMVFYWINLISNLSNVCIPIAVLSFLFAFFLLVVSFTNWEEKDKEIEKQRKKKCFKLSMYVFNPILVLVFAVFTLTPTESTMYKMLAAKYATKDNIENATEFIEDFAVRIHGAITEKKEEK